MKKRRFLNNSWFKNFTFLGLPPTPGEPTLFLSGVFCMLVGRGDPDIEGPTLGGLPCCRYCCCLEKKKKPLCTIFFFKYFPFFCDCLP